MRKHADGYHHRGFIVRKCYYLDPGHAGPWRVIIRANGRGPEYPDRDCPHFANLRDAEQWLDDVVATTLAAVTA